MIRTSLACDVNGEWHIGQLAPKLQEIIRLYPTHFAGALVQFLCRKLEQEIRTCYTYRKC